MSRVVGLGEKSYLFKDWNKGEHVGNARVVSYTIG